MSGEASTAAPRRRKGKSPRDRQCSSQKLPQLPWRQVQNPYPPMAILSEDQLNAIHETSLRVIEELGIELMSSRAIDLFREAGAEVDDSSGLVKADRNLIMEAVREAPSSFTLKSRNAEKQLVMGGNNMAFGLVAGPPNVHDCVNGRRPGNLEDYRNFTRLAHYFNAIHMLGNQVVAPVELPANTRHMDTYRANIELSDLCFHASGIGRGKSMEELKSEPGVATIISVNSPRKFDDAMVEGLMAMSEHGQVAVVTPFTLMGAMTPVTLAAGLTQQNAGALFGVALSTPGKAGKG